MWQHRFADHLWHPWQLGCFLTSTGFTGNDVFKTNDRAKLDLPFRKAFHQKPSFIKELVKLGYLAHQSGKWWEGSWKDGGFTHGMTHGDPKEEQAWRYGIKNRPGWTQAHYRFCRTCPEGTKTIFIMVRPFSPSHALIIPLSVC